MNRKDERLTNITQAIVNLIESYEVLCTRTDVHRIHPTRHVNITINSCYSLTVAAHEYELDALYCQLKGAIRNYKAYYKFAFGDINAAKGRPTESNIGSENLDC
ncbi:unnamed protein product [Angiostrongylus costaricensis]|uniref:Ribosome-binding factor A n=1 Tax=Angiostrongylus costaricensis TaxID=334426 RepID=A0A0R3PBK6_ANGCS|nr:unnamed protein product [Angiostrongylus costaricensis]